MPTRHQASYELHHGLITPPASPTKPDLHLHERSRFSSLQALTLQNSGQNPEVNRRETISTRHASFGSAQSCHHSDTTWKSLKSSSSLENTPPNHDERTDKLFVDPKHLQPSSRLRSQGNGHLVKVDDNQLLRRINKKKVSWTGLRCKVVAVGPAACTSPVLETFDGQSSLELSGFEIEHSNETECSIKEKVNVTFPRTSCFLADCTLNQRLRPSQSVQAYRTPASQTRDRFLTPRRVDGSTKDVLMLGKEVLRLTSREQLRRRRTGSLDPFGPARLHQRYSAPLPSSRMQQISRADRLPSANVLGQRHDALSNANRRTTIGGGWSAGVVSPWVTNLSGSPIGSANTPVYSSDFLQRHLPRDDTEIYENRLALAFDVDQTNRVLEAQSSATSFSTPTSTNSYPNAGQMSTITVWKDNEWIREGIFSRMEINIVQFLFRWLIECFNRSKSSQVIQATRTDDRFQISELTLPT